MRTLTEKQIEFINNTFFQHKDYPGSLIIGYTLLTNGKTIVAGKECIWKGGIGNFIKVSETTLAIGCVLYEFDLEMFLSSEWFKEFKEYKLDETKEHLKMLNEKIKETSLLLHDIESL